MSFSVLCCSVGSTALGFLWLHAFFVTRFVLLFLFPIANIDHAHPACKARKTVGSHLLSLFLSVSHHHCQTLTTCLTTTITSISCNSHLHSMCRLTPRRILTPRSLSSVNAPSDPSIVLQIKMSTTARLLGVVVVVVVVGRWGHRLPVMSVWKLGQRCQQPLRKQVICS